MGYGYKTTLVLDNEEYDVIAYSYAFEKDINEKGEVISPVMGGYIYVSLADIPKNTNLLSWGIGDYSFKDGLIKVTDTAQEKSVVDEELSFEFAACIGMKLMYERDHSNYFTTLLTISAKKITLGRKESCVNKNWRYE